jgi:hypothetical protein
MLNALIDRFQAKLPPNRLVALALAVLVPTLIAPAAGSLAVWVPAHFPGLPAFTSAQLTAYGVAGVWAALLAGATAGYKFIDGWQKHESRESAKAHELELARIEGEIEQVIALIHAGHMPESVMDLLDGAKPEGAKAPSSPVVPPRAGF